MTRTRRVCADRRGETVLATCLSDQTDILVLETKPQRVLSRGANVVDQLAKIVSSAHAHNMVPERWLNHDSIAGTLHGSKTE